MSVAVEERQGRHARARAVAASIVDTPRVPRRFHIPETLRSSPRRRVSGDGTVERLAPTWPARLGRLMARRRRIALAVLLVQLAALAAVLLLPAFRLKGIDIRGAHLLRTDAILRASGLSPTQSIFTVDGDRARSGIAALDWVRSVTVETELPATVRITVVEQRPALRVRRADGDILVASSGATVPVADAQPGSVPATLPLLDDQRPVAPGDTPAALDPALLRLLADAADRFPAIAGCAMTGFVWQPDGLLTIVTAPGWRAVLGFVADSDAVARIPAQLAALASLRGRLDMVHPSFGYIDLENPDGPAVGGAPGQTESLPTSAPVPSGAGHSDTTVHPAAPAPQPAARPAPAAPQAPRPTPAPTAAPHVVVTRPGGHPPGSAPPSPTPPPRH